MYMYVCACMTDVCTCMLEEIKHANCIVHTQGDSYNRSVWNVDIVNQLLHKYTEALTEMILNMCS